MPRTKAKIQTVTNTQLGVAVLAAFMAGGLAFAAAPAQNRAAAAQCVPFNINFRTTTSGVACPAGQFKVADVTCPNNQRSRAQYRDCKTQDFFRQKANTFCANKQCANPPVAQTSTLSINIDNNSDALRYDRYALAGNDRFLAGKIKFDATNENIMVRDLALQFYANSAFTALRDMESSIDRVEIYTNPNLATATLIGSADYTSSTVIIQDINYQIPQGTASLYIALDLNSVGADIDGTAVPNTAFQIAAASRGTVARGLASNDNIVPQVGNTRTTDITVAPVKITNVSSDFAGGNLVGGQQNIFSFEVTANAGRNTTEVGDSLGAHLRQLRLDLTSDIGTAISSNTANFQLCRVDTNTCIMLTTPDGQALSDRVTNTALVTYNQTRGTFIDMSEFENMNDAIIESGETVEFIVRGTFSNITDKFVQVRLNSLNNGGLVYGIDMDEGTDQYTFTDIRLDPPRSPSYPHLIGRSLQN